MKFLFAVLDISTDPLCRLDKHERFRLCNLIFNSEFFRDKVRMPPSYHVVDNIGCDKMRVSFRTIVTQSDERMIRCFLGDIADRNPDANLEKMYYLSRGYNDTEGNEALNSNDVFVYRRTPQGMFLVNAFTNVRLGLFDNQRKLKSHQVSLSKL